MVTPSIRGGIVERVDRSWNPARVQVVTGVSAGGLIAPFAFMGSRYDDVIQTVSTTVGPGDVFHRNLLTGLAGDGMADSKPLSQIIAKYVTPEASRRRGRRICEGENPRDRHY